MQWFIVFIIIVAIISFVTTFWPVAIAFVTIWAIWKVYESIYYKSKAFQSIKMQIQSYVNDCNDLNRHIENLKSSHLGANQLDYGQASYINKSQWNYKRPELKKQEYAPNIYNCSRTVCDNARRQPFKYICKYFNLKATEETLENVEEVLNNFEAAEQGKIVLKEEKTQILTNIKNQIPTLIKAIWKKRLEKQLGFEYIDFSTTYFPKYIFKYISSGGNASMQCDITMDIENLNRFIIYLSEIIKFKKSVAGQRALMTSSLRQKIMRRDNFTCVKCGISTKVEPHLLLEIDHITPISKGGLTTENNLRTLCWKCNREKGAKIEDSKHVFTKHKMGHEIAVHIVENVHANDSTLSINENSDLNNDIAPLIYVLKEIAQKKASKSENNNMYNKEKGIYPLGQYLVGENGLFIVVDNADIQKI